MIDNSDDILQFVNLLEKHANVLSKSQTNVNKKKKEEAAVSINAKWQDISKTELTQEKLFKKINNLKTRAKSALKCGKTLNDWQTKLLKIMNNNIDEDEDNTQPNQIDLDACDNPVSTTMKRNAEQILNELETDDTKVLNNDQLQRYVLLQQARVLSLQHKRLEHLSNIENGKKITFDFIGFEDEIENANPVVTKT